MKKKGKKNYQNPRVLPKQTNRFFSFLPSFEQSVFFSVSPDVDRMVDSYRKISINNLELEVPNAPLHQSIQLRIIPDKESGVSEVRFWYRDNFLGSQKVKNTDLNLVQF